MISLYFISFVLGLDWGNEVNLSVASVIISGGITGLIIGSNRMAPPAGIITGATLVGLFFIIFSSFSAPTGNIIIYFLQSILTGGLAGGICSIFVHRYTKIP